MMRWGIAFKIPATMDVTAYGLPPPSEIITINKEGWLSKGLESEVRILYHFKYAPQSQKEWQRVAGIKVQINNRLPHVKFEDYSFSGGGHQYKVSELGAYFTEFVKFPAPFFDGTPQMVLTRHAKRLHYESMLHVEQLIFVSMWITQLGDTDAGKRRPNSEGITQTMKRAFNAYEFALEHKEDWKVKLTYSALKQVKRDNMKRVNDTKKEQAQTLKAKARKLWKKGRKQQAIADELGIGYSTVKRYVKGIKRG